MSTVTLEPRGSFSLRESALLPFGGRDGHWDGRMRLAFTTDDLAHQAGVVVTQRDGAVHAEIIGDADPVLVREQVARMLSLDVDGRGFDAVGERDPLVAALQRLRPGLRPPLFHSPYEAAVWAVLSARRPASQMARVRTRLGEAHGATFALAGQEVSALPTPTQLLAVTAFPGIPEEKLTRMHAVARAALDGGLDPAHLVGIGPDAAMRELQRLPGIGPFYAALVVIRACGFTDVLPTQEPRFLDLVRRLHHLDAPPSEAELTRIAEPWRPFRTWAAVLVRAAGEQLLAGAAA